MKQKTYLIIRISVGTIRFTSCRVIIRFRLPCILKTISYLQQLHFFHFTQAKTTWRQLIRSLITAVAFQWVVSDHDLVWTKRNGHTDTRTREKVYAHFTHQIESSITSYCYSHLAPNLRFLSCRDHFQREKHQNTPNQGLVVPVSSIRTSFRRPHAALVTLPDLRL